MKKCYLVIMLAIFSWSVNSQTVSIPDTHFATWLQTNHPSCMTGNLMDTTCASIINTTSVDLRWDSIADLTGIQYFTSLNYLNCKNNLITTIPSLPHSLTSFLCDSNQLASLPILPDSLSFLSCEINQLTSLPVLPVTLDTLMCGMNYLTTLPALPLTLRVLSCYQNQLTSLPALDSLLTDLICFDNLLTGLPALDSSLLILSCGINQLTTLPALPDGLTSLTCYSNQLTSLPALDSSLTYLDCSINQLHNLPVLPNSLITLNCGTNNLVNLPLLPNSITALNCNTDSLIILPTLPTSLTDLNCSNNYLPILPSLPTPLNYLQCGGNLLPTLPSLPIGLTTLICYSNQLTLLPTLPLSLNNLWCDNNLLTGLPVLPNSLNILSCSNNLLTSLPTLSISLANLFCQNNPLINLPWLPNSLIKLNCEQSQLNSLPNLPPIISYLLCDNNNISCFPVFPDSLRDSLHFNISGNPFTCLPNYIPAMNWATLSNPLCGIGNVSGCASSVGIVGYTYKDNNTNCVKDTTDNIFVNVPLKCYNTINNLLSQTYTAVNGVYDFPDTTGTYIVKLDTANVPFTFQCPNPGVDSTVVLTTANPLIQNVNFDLICKPGFDIGTQSVVTNGIVFPGQTHKIQIMAGDMSHWYHMNCASGISGIVQVTVTGPVSFSGIVAGALTPSISTNVYTYSIADFATIQNSTDFGLQFTTSTFAHNGDLVCVNVIVTPSGGDNDTTNNNFQYCYKVINSFDPNCKETYPEIVLENTQDYFTYTIHFQNTGTASAINIRLLDTLDSKLNLATFQVINYSHTNVVSLTGRLLTFNFHNINLPDSTSDSEGSKGFVQYRIKPNANQLGGTFIHNTAYIYFDFNSPVLTNTSLNAFVRMLPVSTNELKQNESISVFPNPFTSITTICFSEAPNHSTIKIIDVIGNIIISQPLTNGKTQTKIDMSNVPSGIYFVQVQTEKGMEYKKIVKQ